MIALNGYRISHRAPGYGAHYNVTHEIGYYAALWAKIERPLIAHTLRPMGGPGRKCLDFACGTGRITNVLADLFGEVVGVDVSESMLSVAQVPRNVRLRLVDITTEPLPEKFHVITAFRFFLNAEDHLRREALQSMREHLDENGMLVCNIHMNATSPIGIACRISNSFHRRTVRNTLSIGEFKELVISAGFSVENVIPYGYLPRPGNLLPRFCEATIAPVEKVSKVIGISGRLAQHFLLIARKAQ
ncbi:MULTISPECIES: class I SAM-dependent methyltransferase [Mesorhizobium]|uniref:class I SAM-dependent methyltransferase n=1 Tax=Mesorhizobium sp. TaxID=1871066 RepID=UPI001F11CB0F|nr:MULTISPECIES: class I SAM-dependent methyltransferase [Mesorhizobium]